MDTLTRRASPAISTDMGGPQTIELFCGARKAFSQTARALGYATFTVDKNSGCEPHLVTDILNLDAARLPENPLIVWAAPPHGGFSKEHWRGIDPVDIEGEAAQALLGATISLLSKIKPKWWFIENPKSVLRSLPIMAGFNRGYPSRNMHTIRHDEYGGKTAAKTDVWTNAYWWIPRPGIRSGEGGAETGRRVPPSVFVEIFEQLDTYRTTGRYGPRE